MYGDVAALVVNVGLRVFRIATTITVEENFHRLLDELLSPNFTDWALFCDLSEDWESQMGSKACCDDVASVCTSSEVNVSKERLIVLHSSDDQVHPQWIEFGTAIVQDSREPSVEILRLEGDFIVGREVRKDRFIDILLQMLEVGVVAGDAQDDVVVDFENSVDVVVTSHVSVRNEHVSSNNHSLVISHSDD